MHVFVDRATQRPAPVPEASGRCWRGSLPDHACERELTRRRHGDCFASLAMTACRNRRRNAPWISASKARRRSSARRARGSAAPARCRWRAKASIVVITARTAADLEKTADEIRKETGVKVTAGPRRHHHRGRPRRGARRLPAARHPGEQRRRPAARRLPRMGPRRLDQGGRCQHADADLPDQGRGRRHDRPQVRPHRQHHLGVGEVADPGTRHEQRRARRPHRLRRRPRAADRHGTT